MIVVLREQEQLRLNVLQGEEEESSMTVIKKYRTTIMAVISLAVMMVTSSNGPPPKYELTTKRYLEVSSSTGVQLVDGLITKCDSVALDSLKIERGQAPKRRVSLDEANDDQVNSRKQIRSRNE